MTNTQKAFTDYNTEGFTETELDTLNAAFDAIVGDGEDEEGHVTDRLNNLWIVGATNDDIVARYHAQYPQG